MNRHPGGEAQTLHLLEYVKFRKGMEALDLGAGEGETVRILKSLGINAHGVDLSPRSRDVQKGDFLNLDYTAESMDLCISQCAFFVSGDQQKAVSECWRVLKKGGLLVLSDLDAFFCCSAASGACGAVPAASEVSEPSGFSWLSGISVFTISPCAFA